MKCAAGCGLERSFRIDAAAGTPALNLDRFKTRPYGIEGGEPGAAGHATLTRANGEVEQLPSKVAGMRIAKGDILPPRHGRRRLRRSGSQRQRYRERLRLQQ